MPRTIDAVRAGFVFNVLRDECGASEELRKDFIYQMGKGCQEYRFQGALGFGGKFYNAHVVYVSCYREDETSERLAAIRIATEKCRRLLAEAK
jgi:hypothetical protein